MRLSRSFAYDGMRILDGDKLSRGAFVPATEPKAGTRIKVQYVGLPGDPSVSVSFK